MGVFNERLWRIERHGREVPVVLQHNVTANRFDVTVGGFSVPMRVSQSADGATLLVFAVQGQAATIVVSTQVEGATYELMLGEELAPPRAPPPSGVAPLSAAPSSTVPAPPERFSMPRPPMGSGAPAKKSSAALIFVACVIAFLVAAGVFAALSRNAIISLLSPKITWKTFEPAGGRFAVDMPEGVKEETQTQETAAGPLTIHLFTADVKTRAFSAGYFDFPARVPSERIDAVLEGSRDGAVKQTNGRLLESKRTEYLGYPALEFAADVPQGTTLQRVYLIDSRMYYLVVASVKPMKAEEAEQFFSSFRLTRL